MSLRLTYSRYPSPLILMGRLRVCENQAKVHIISNFVTSIGPNIVPDLDIAQSFQCGLGLRLSRKDLTLVDYV